MMSDRTGRKVSPHSESIESIDGYSESAQTLGTMTREVGGAGPLLDGLGSAADCTSFQTSAVSSTCNERKEEGDIVLLRASSTNCQDGLRGPFPVTYKATGTLELAPQTSQPAVTRRTVKNSKNVKRRAKSQENFDVPAALKSLRRRPRSGFPQRPSIIGRRGVYPHIGAEDQWGSLGNLGGESSGNSDHRWRTYRSEGSVPETEIHTRDNRSCSSRDSWADVSNDDSSSCSSPLGAGGPDLCLESEGVTPERSGEESRGMQPPRATASPVGDPPEAELCSQFERASISPGEGLNASPDVVTCTTSRADSQSGHAQRRNTNRESMALARENLLEGMNPSPSVIGSRFRLDRSNQPQEATPSHTNIFVTTSSPANHSHVTSPQRAPGASAAVFVFPDQQPHTDPHMRTASVAPAPNTVRSTATMNYSVVTPPRQPGGAGRKGKGRGVPRDYSEIPAALRSLRRKPRSGFRQRTSHMQVGPQEVVRGAHGGGPVDERTLDNVETDQSNAVIDTPALPNVQEVPLADGIPDTSCESRQSSVRPRRAQTRSKSRERERVTSPVREVPSDTNQSNDTSQGLDPAALQSLRRHPRSGFRRNRPTVSSHFTTVGSEATPSRESAAPRLLSANSVEGADDSRQESQTDPAEQVVVSRRPALADPNHSPPPAYDDLFFYSIGDDVGDVFVPEEFRPQLPSYDDVLRLSQDSPPPYMEPDVDDGNGESDS